VWLSLRYLKAHRRFSEAESAFRFVVASGKRLVVEDESLSFAIFFPSVVTAFTTRRPTLRLRELFSESERGRLFRECYYLFPFVQNCDLVGFAVFRLLLRTVNETSKQSLKGRTFSVFFSRNCGRARESVSVVSILLFEVFLLGGFYLLLRLVAVHIVVSR